MDCHCKFLQEHILFQFKVLPKARNISSVFWHPMSMDVAHHLMESIQSVLNLHMIHQRLQASLPSAPLEETLSIYLGTNLRMMVDQELRDTGLRRERLVLKFGSVSI